MVGSNCFDPDHISAGIVFRSDGGLDFYQTRFVRYLRFGGQRTNGRIVDLAQLGFDLDRIFAQRQFKVVIVTFRAEHLDGDLAGYLSLYGKIRGAQGVDNGWGVFADGVFDLQIEWDGDFVSISLSPVPAGICFPRAGTMMVWPT